jgi:hypothetical protein
MSKLPALLAALTCAAIGAVHAAPPPLPIDQALKLAQEHLSSRGLAGQHYIGSLTIESSALTGGKTYWFARWVPSIPNQKSSESGLRINMDGSLVRLTTGSRSDRPAAGGRVIR